MCLDRLKPADIMSCFAEGVEVLVQVTRSPHEGQC